MDRDYITVFLYLIRLDLAIKGDILDRNRALVDWLFAGSGIGSELYVSPAQLIYGSVLP